MSSVSRESAVIYTGNEFNPTNSVAPPIFQTSSFQVDSAEQFHHSATTPLSTDFYTRYGNPSQQHPATIVAELEGAENALVFSSGVSAAATTALTLLKAGDHVIAQTVLYTGTTGLLQEMLSKFGVTSTFVDQRDPAAFEAAITDRTRLIWVESPSNPLMQLTDLAAIGKLARERGILTICDNTVATPFNQRPLDLGIDLALHSATKAMGGHADLMAGVIAGPQALIDQIWHSVLVIGGILGPIDAWLLLRGLRTLPLRVERLNKNALAVASYLEAHPRVTTVYYPGLPSHPQHELARRQMSGFGCLLSFELDGDQAMAERFVHALRHVKQAASFGNFESLVFHPAAVWSSHSTPEELLAAGIKPALLRLAVGLEHPDDLIADLEQALHACAAGSRVPTGAAAR
ncbi:MAG: cystathionine gamma-lyase [Candidatus Eremiobacteraeota bacterium]|nr:cystathionine gamma-lyase [Candidatus Eremiobacteraeota bacterium]